MLHIDILRSAYDAVTKVGEEFSEALQSGPTGAQLLVQKSCVVLKIFSMEAKSWATGPVLN